LNFGFTIFAANIAGIAKVHQEKNDYNLTTTGFCQGFDGGIRDCHDGIGSTDDESGGAGDTFRAAPGADGARPSALDARAGCGKAPADHLACA
jgi:hypothetical protein